MTAGIELFPVAIGAYDYHPPLDVDPEVSRLARLLADLGAEVVRPWGTPMIDRGRDAVDARLQQWSSDPRGPTIFYWIGHGWSKTTTAALAHARSPLAVGSHGITPDVLADHIAAWEARADDFSWLLVVIDACQSARYVELLAAALDDRQGPRRIMLIGTAGRGATTLGRFTESLESALRWTFGNDAEFSAMQLCSELYRKMQPGAQRRVLNVDDGTAVLRRSGPTLAGYTGPLDIRDALSSVLADLPDDERRHFIPKAQGGELRDSGAGLGEASWYFTGRRQERIRILEWLNSGDGMLVVTGRAGAGKSALLGDILVRSRPALARVLLDHRLLDSAPVAPPAGFDSALHLTGLRPVEVIARLCADLALSPPAPERPLTAHVDHLLGAVARLAVPPRILVDALDESVDPVVLAGVLRRLGGIPGIRLIVGTRQSTREGPDQPETDDVDLLEALGGDNTLLVARDPEAIAHYVSRRLLSADVVDVDHIQLRANEICAVEQEFLYARLAVHELLARPELLAGDAPVPTVLGRSHRSLFAAAVARLTARDARYRPLLLALALAHGRGAPIRDNVWAVLAEAAAGAPVADDVFDAFINDAAPYLAVDSEHDQTVYRLAHRAFAEHLTTNVGATRDRHHRIVELAIREISRTTPNSYWIRYTAEHAAAGRAASWTGLNESVSVLDRLDPDALASAAMRSLFGHTVIPPQIAGVIRMAHHLRHAAPGGRAGLRHLGAALNTGAHHATERDSERSPWTLVWASLRPQPLHLALTGHGGSVAATASIALAESTSLLATAGHDGTIRLWDPTSGAEVGKPLSGHIGPVLALSPVRLADGRDLLVSGGHDGTIRLWDVQKGLAVDAPLLGHVGPVLALVALQLADGRPVIVSGGDDGTVRLWDPVARVRVGPVRRPRSPWRLLTGDIRIVALATVSFEDGSVVVASGGEDGKVRLWDAASGELRRVSHRIMKSAESVLPPSITALARIPQGGRTMLAYGTLDGLIWIWDPGGGSASAAELLCVHPGPPRALTAVQVASLHPERALIASSCDDTTIRLWDPDDGRAVGEPLGGHTAPVHTLATAVSSGGRTLLASGGDDGAVRLWDPLSLDVRRSAPVERSRGIAAVAAVQLTDTRTLLAAGGDSGTIQLWDGTTWSSAGSALVGHNGAVLALESLHFPTAEHGVGLLASAGRDGKVGLWNAIDGTQIATLLRHDHPVYALTSFSMQGRRVLATGGHGARNDGTVWLWDPVSAAAIRRLTGNVGQVWALVAIPLRDGRTLLASGGAGSVRIWDPTTGLHVAELKSGRRTDPWATFTKVSALAAVSSSNRQVLLAASGQGPGDDEVVRLWNAETLQQVGDLAGHSGSISALATVTMPNGRTILASGGEDGVLRLWRVDRATLCAAVPFENRILVVSSFSMGRVAVGLETGVAVVDVTVSPTSAW